MRKMTCARSLLCAAIKTNTAA